MLDTPNGLTVADVHCHLGAYPGLGQILEDITSRDTLVIAATSRPSEFRALRALIGQNRNVEVGLGMHPECAGSVYERTELEIFNEVVSDARWISEIGVDGYIADRVSANFGSVPGLAAQTRLFETMLELTDDSHCYSVHSRLAEDTVLDILVASSRQRVVLHSFSGSAESAKRVLDSGFIFSIGPSALHSPEGQDFIRWIPAEHLLVESDGPYFDWEDRRVSPADALQVARQIAHIRNDDPEALMSVMRATLDRLLNSPSEH